MNQSINEIVEKLKRNYKELGITLYNPATLEIIAALENAKGIKLPDEIKTFYKFCNGFESEEDMFRIIPIEEIIDNIKDRETYMTNPKDLHFAEYMIYCDMWTLNINPLDNNDYKIYNMTETVVTLTTSFTEFLEVFLNKGVFEGLYNWRENIQRLTN
jgi:hypothetical protein